MKKYILGILAISIISCQKESSVIIPTSQNVNISGSVFKGTFLRGSSLTFFELDNTLSQTGKTFITSIDDDYGNFSVNARITSGSYVKVVGNGYYWNEVTNENTISTLSLNSICKADSSINVNVLTHLEAPRVQYLYTNGLSFDSAKSQAIREVLQVFGYTNTGIKRAEKVSVTGNVDGSKILLAISTLIQGFRTESEVTQLLNDIANDIKNDGILSDVRLGNDLANHLFYVDTTSVLNNFKNKYVNLYGEVSNVNMQYIKQFINSTSYKKDKDLIEYPATGNKHSFPNLLNASTSKLSNNDRGMRSYTFVAIIKKGMKLRVELTDSNGNSIPDSFIGPSGSILFNCYNDAVGWTINKTNQGIGNKPVATANALYNECFNRFIGFNLPDSVKTTPIIKTTPINTYKIKFYENGTFTPTNIKTIIVE
jgi:hypothetical protein